MGLWKPTPRDIFKSRWKRFYKRCYRPRGAGNTVDQPPPHNQSRFLPDGVPSPWKLGYSLENFQQGKLPVDLRRTAFQTYKDNIRTFMMPADRCREGTASDCILRCLDPGRHGRSGSGLGRLEASWGRPEGNDSDKVPGHILNIIKSELKEKKTVEECLSASPSLFHARRLYQLCEEKEIVWDNGLNDPRRHDVDDGRGGRGHFPYIDEKAGLIDELTLKEILRIGHRTNSRRHPKWKELQFWYKKWHRQYLRRRQMLKDEVKSRMGVLKQALPDI